MFYVSKYHKSSKHVMTTWLTVTVVTVIEVGLTMILWVIITASSSAAVVVEVVIIALIMITIVVIV